MRINLLIFMIITYILLSAYYFDGCECGKKKKLLKAAKLILLGAALKSKKTILPIPLPIPIPFKVEKHVAHHEPIPYPVYKPYPEPIFIHEHSYGYHGGYSGGYGGGYSDW